MTSAEPAGASWVAPRGAPTGVTGGELVKGIQQVAEGVRTQTLLIGGADRTCNIIDSLH